jgi:hypothetical protein
MTTMTKAFLAGFKGGTKMLARPKETLRDCSAQVTAESLLRRSWEKVGRSIDRSMRSIPLQANR